MLPGEKQLAVIGALVEGNSIRSTERMLGIHRATIMRLGLRVGEGCAVVLDERMRDLMCERLELDEPWAFVGKKPRHVRADDDASRVGDCWTWVVIDATTKLVPSSMAGKRDAATADAFIKALAARLRNRVQVTTDVLRHPSLHATDECALEEAGGPRGSGRASLRARQLRARSLDAACDARDGRTVWSMSALLDAATDGATP